MFVATEFHLPVWRSVIIINGKKVNIPSTDYIAVASFTQPVCSATEFNQYCMNCIKVKMVN